MLELLTSVCLFPAAIPSVSILLKSVTVFEDNNLIFLHNMLLSVLFAYRTRVSRGTDLSSVALTRNPGSVEM